MRVFMQWYYIHFEVRAVPSVQASSPPPTPVAPAQLPPLAAAMPPLNIPSASSPPSAALAYRATSSVSLSYTEGAVVPGQFDALQENDWHALS